MSSIHYKLTAGQYIRDLSIKIDPKHYVTHLCADTGMGKSSWVMEELCEKGNVIFAVPQRAQITQLQARYGDRDDVEFIYGGHSILSDNPLNIVCTYDQLPFIQSKIHSFHYLLVIDEVHKLYQAASYRTEAISNLVDVILDERFAQVLTLSATFTPGLVPYPIDTWLEVSRTSEVERDIELQLYTGRGAMEELVIGQLNATGQGPAVVRINNKQDIAAYRKLIEAKGLRCLVVHRGLQASDSVVNMLTAESMAGYDVVLTTSLLDEAVNINDAEIAELIVFNSRIHPEELKQFMGRFRRTNPPVRICLPRYRLGAKSKALNVVKQTNDRVVKVAEQLAQVILLDCDTLQTVRKANETLRELFGFEPLRMKQAKIAANDVAIMANLYACDTEQSYQSLQSLEDALRKVIKHLSFTVIDCSDSGDEDVSRELDDAYDAIRDDWYKALERSKDQVRATMAKTKQAGAGDLDTLDTLERSRKQFPPESLEQGILDNWLNLHRDVMPDMWEAYDAIEQERAVKVWQFHESARGNLYLEPMLRQMMLIPKGTVMTLEEARQCILETLREVSRQYPNIKELIAASNVPGITVKRNNHFGVTDRYVRHIFRFYTATPPVRSNNRDKIVFNGVGPFGYRYRIVDDGLSTPTTKKKIRKFRRIKPAA